MSARNRCEPTKRLDRHAPSLGRVAGCLLVLLASAGLLTHCAASRSADDASTTLNEAGAAHATGVLVTPHQGATGVTPDTRVAVAVRAGRLQKVAVHDSQGNAVPGSGDGHHWNSIGRLAPDRHYTVTVTTTNKGHTTTTRSTFQTLKPDVTATYSILHNGETVGVGMPAIVQFDSSVATAKQRAEVERLVTVKTSPPTEGHWGWLDTR